MKNKKINITVGAVYKNKWGDIRIPFALAYGQTNDIQVRFIEMRSSQKKFSYNPYMNTVTLTTFNDKFKPTPDGIPSEEVGKVIRIANTMDYDWNELLLRGVKMLNKISTKIHGQRK